MNYKLESSIDREKASDVQKIPHVLANFFVSSDKCNFQLRYSSKRGPKNFTYLAFAKCFLPVLIDVPSGIFIEEWKIK